MNKTISSLLAVVFAFFLLNEFLKDAWFACWPSYAGRNHNEI